MTDVQWREIDIDAVERKNDPEAEYTGPGSGFAPYIMSNGRMKYDGAHRNPVPRAPDRGVEKRVLWAWDLGAKNL